MTQATLAGESVAGERRPSPEPIRAKSITRRAIAPINPGWLAVLAAAGLSLIGVTAIGTTEPGLAMRQMIFLMIGIVAGGVLAVPHYAWMRRLSYALLVIVLVMLIFLLIPAVPDVLVRPRNGARRWINLGVTDFQPSELAKIAFVLALANYFRYRRNYRRLRGLLVPFVLTFIPMGLILREPDLGTSLLFLPTLFAVLIAAGAKLRHIVLIVVLGLAAAPVMYPFLKPHQKARIVAMIGLLKGDTRLHDNIGFQGDRAMTLVGAGGVAGVGREHARDLVIYNRLPEEHNDMIFAVVASRWGLLGGAGVIVACVVFAAGGLLTAGMCKDPFGRLVAVGIVAVLSAQAFINVGMTIGLLPITGMTLPFVSYGGSSLVVNWMMTGILLNIALRRPPMLARESFEFDGDEARS